MIRATGRLQPTPRYSAECPVVNDPSTYGDEIAVVTVTYFPGETLDRFLDTLSAATDRRVRVVLADNGSTDGAPERAEIGRAHV